MDDITSFKSAFLKIKAVTRCELEIYDQTAPKDDVGCGQLGKDN
jgi:hypothetical protein